MSPSIFKAYDIRGRYPQELDEVVAEQIAAVLACYFRQGRVIVARDARLSSPALYRAVLRGLVKHNDRLVIHRVGLATTPMFYFLTRRLKAAGGIMITASHNPKEYNGLKVMGLKGKLISGKDTEKIRKQYSNILQNVRILSKSFGFLGNTNFLGNIKEKTGKETSGDYYLKIYVDFLQKFFKPRRRLKVVFDCSNGTVGIILKKLLRELHTYNYKSKNQVFNSKFIFINSRPDGNFPAHSPNPLAQGALDNLRQAVVKHHADVGAIFDADGDRVFFVDDRGRPLATDIPIILMSRQTKGPVLLTADIGMLAREILSSDKRKIIDSRIGHYFIKKLARKKRVSFAAENSGHYYFKKFYYFDSAILAALHFINAVSRLPSTLSSWVDVLPKYYRADLNFQVSNKSAAIRNFEARYKHIASAISHLDGLKMEFNKGEKSEWWFNLRPSNTEDLLRLNLEAKDYKIFQGKLQEFKRMI